LILLYGKRAEQERPMTNANPNDGDLSSRKALVVGAYGGMGHAITAALAREGVACALMGRSRQRLEETAHAFSEARTTIIPVVCDLTQSAAIETAVRDAISGLGGLNFVINCAGTYELSRGDIGDLSIWDEVLDVNLRATYHIARHALPEINRSSGGAIIKIGSISSSYSGAGASLTTSRGLDGYADALFEDIREYGTKVCIIRPGFVNTPLVNSGRLDRSRMIQPDDVARTVLFVLKMPERACPTEITLRPQRSPYRSA
jgi:NADP-dependent 3-hydroxy acid dehydrogenase YdfG